MPLTTVGCLDRRERLWNAAPADADVLIVGDPAHLTYFAGYVASPYAFRSAESGAVLLLEPGHATLVADSMVGPFLDQAHVDERVAPSWYEAVKPAPYRQGMLVESVLGRLGSIRAKKVGVEMAAVPAGIIEGLLTAKPGVEIVDIGPLIRPLRRSKDPDELDLIRRSVKAGEAAHAALLHWLKPGMTEMDAYRMAVRNATESLGEPTTVYGDFASGPRTWTERGGPPGMRTIGHGDLIILDFSVIVDNYRGDFTNTIAVGGGPTSEQRAMFDACVGAIEAGEEALKPGTVCRDVDAAVKAHLRSRGMEEHFGSHSGHGLGLGHPEPPYLVRESDETLMVGDVVALEPGLYINGVGGMRFERNYLITKTGFETLSHHELRIEQ